MKCLIIAFLGFLLVTGASSSGAMTGTVVKAEMIQSAIADYVHRLAPLEPAAIRIEYTARMNDITLPLPLKNLNDLEFQVSSTADTFIGNMTFLVKISHLGRLIREERVTARLEQLQEVVVTNRALPKDAVITEADVKIVQKWVRRQPTGQLDNVQEAIGKRVIASIRANTELRSSLLAEQVIVKKGRNVRIVLHAGPMLISAVGLSEQDGTMGEIIKVKNISSSRIIFARVINDSLVQVDF